MIKTILKITIAASFLLGCAATHVTPISQKRFILSTSAAPACGRIGAQKVALKMAAVETLRKGHPRFLILGQKSANNVSVIDTAPTGSYTTGTYDVYGNTVYGRSQTTYTGGGPIVFGSNDADLNVLMLAPGDNGFDQGVDAKSILGENWKTLVEKGVHTCTN